MATDDGDSARFSATPDELFGIIQELQSQVLALTGAVVSDLAGDNRTALKDANRALDAAAKVNLEIRKILERQGDRANT